MKKNRKKSLLKKTFIILTTIGLLVLHFYIPRFITEIKNPLLILFKPNYINTMMPSFENTQLEGEYIQFTSFDKTELTGYITYSDIENSKGTIILLHGIRSNKESYIALSEKLAHLGYDTVAMDLRAHGQSKGIHCTFGVKEKQDVSQLIDFLLKNKNTNPKIGIWGRSLGGAIALQTMGFDKRIKFGIIESAFSDFKTITNDYFRYHVGFNVKPLTNYLISRSGKIAAFNPEEAKPSYYCKKIEQPILIVHGNKDMRINIKYAKENFENIISKQKEFIEIENANHLNVWRVGGNEYFNKTDKFINEYTN